MKPPKQETRNIAVPLALHTQAKTQASSEGVSLSDFNATALTDLLKRKATAVKHPAAKGRKGL